MKKPDLIKQLANRINQPHVIESWINKIEKASYNKGCKDLESKQLIIADVSKSLVKLIQEQNMSAELRTYLMEINLKLS